MKSGADRLNFTQSIFYGLVHVEKNYIYTNDMKKKLKMKKILTKYTENSRDNISLFII